MPIRKIPNYLRSYRKKAGLSQDQMAFLLGCKSGAKISRYERFEREPSLRTALAYEAAFRQPVRKLFDGIYREIEQQVDRRARSLAHRLENGRDKLKLL